MKKSILLILISVLCVNISSAQASAPFLSIYGFVNKSYSLPLDHKIRDRPDYLKQNDNLNTSLQFFWGMKPPRKYNFIFGIGYENRFSYSDKYYYSDLCQSQVKEFSKVYVRNINSIALSPGIIIKPFKKLQKFSTGVYFNFGLTTKSWYKELVNGECSVNKNYFENSNGNIYYSSNLIFQYSILNLRNLILDFTCKISHRSYRFFFSDMNFGGGITLRYNLNSK